MSSLHAKIGVNSSVCSRCINSTRSAASLAVAPLRVPAAAESADPFAASEQIAFVYRRCRTYR